jgi:competence protein ComEC
VQSETTIFTNIKAHIENTYGSYLPKDQSKLLMGIVFGGDPPVEEKEKFIATGVMHVVAASGMNVSMLTAFLLGTLVIFLKRKQALIITAILLVFYTGLANFEPSIVRASIMGILALGASFLGRQNTALFALFLAAFAMIFFDPDILTSISFMLSFSATLGIILLEPLLKSTFLKANLFEDFRTTSSAQIATTPILLFFFGSYSLVSIVVNLLILWTIPPLMVLGTIASVLSFVSPLLAAPFIYLSYPLLSYFYLIVNLFSSFANPIELEKVPISAVVGYYLILFAAILHFRRKKNV